MLCQEALELFRSLQLPLLETTALLLESGAYLGAQDFERSQKLGGKTHVGLTSRLPEVVEGSGLIHSGLIDIYWRFGTRQSSILVKTTHFGVPSF